MRPGTLSKQYKDPCGEKGSILSTQFYT